MNSFFGLNVDFTFSTSSFPNGYSALFFEPHNTYDEVICEGGTCREAWLESDYVWRCSLAESGNYPEYVARYLLEDFKGRYFRGDWNVRPLFDVVPEPPPPPPPDERPWYCKVRWLPSIIKVWLGCS